MSFGNRKILYDAIFVSIVSYCSAIYYPRLSQININKLLSLQRKILINVASGYRTISFPAIFYITGEVPIDIKIELINRTKTLRHSTSFHEHSKHEIENKIAELRAQAVERWQLTYENSTKGRLTNEIIPDVEITHKNKCIGI